MSGDASQVFAEETMTFDGKDYTIKPPTIKTRGLFTSYLEESAVRFVRRNKAHWGDDYPMAMDRVNRKGGVHGFAWGSEAVNEALNNDESMQEFAYLVIRQAHPDISRKLVADLWDAPGGKVTNKDTGEEEDTTKGAELCVKIWRLLSRPNSSRPEPEAATGNP